MDETQHIRFSVRPRKMHNTQANNDDKFPFLAMFIACGIPAAGHPYICHFSQPCTGLRSVLTVVASLLRSLSIFFVMQSVKYSLNTLLSNFLNVKVFFRSTGWRKWVKFFRTMTDTFCNPPVK